MFKWTAIILIMLGALFLSGALANAQCVQDDQDVTCTEQDTNSFVTTEGDLTIVVAEGASVTNEDNTSENAVEIISGNDLTNDGTIAATEWGDGVNGQYDNVIENNGTIYSERKDAIDVQDGNTVINNGTIQSDLNTAIDSGSALNMENNGTIVAGQDAVQTGSSSLIYNNGTIYADTGYGINAGSRASIINEGDISTGMVDAYDAVQVGYSGMVENYGTISGECNGVDGTQQLQLYNGGDIYSENCSGVVAGDDSYIVNDGTITSDQATGNMGMDLSDEVIVENHGTIDGRCRGIDAEDHLYLTNYGDINGYYCDGVYLREEGGTIINHGNISVARTGSDAIDMNYGTVENYGVISGRNDGIEVDASRNGDTHIYNEGLITGQVGINTAMDNNPDQQYIVNNGTITGTSGVAVDLGANKDDFEARVGSSANGVVDGGTEYDVFTIGYHYLDGDAAAEAGYATVQQAVSTASIKNCPCEISFTVFGVNFNYTYVRFDFITSYKQASATGIASTPVPNNVPLMQTEAAVEPEPTVVTTAATPEPVVASAAPAVEPVLAAQLVVESAPVEIVATETTTTVAAENRPAILSQTEYVYYLAQNLF